MQIIAVQNQVRGDEVAQGNLPSLARNRGTGQLDHGPGGCHLYLNDVRFAMVGAGIKGESGIVSAGLLRHNVHDDRTGRRRGQYHAVSIYYRGNVGLAADFDGAGGIRHYRPGPVDGEPVGHGVIVGDDRILANTGAAHDPDLLADQGNDVRISLMLCQRHI